MQPAFPLKDSRPPLFTRHAVNNVSLSLLFSPLLSDSFCTPLTTRLMILKYHLIHLILWLKSTSCLLSLQDFYLRRFISHLSSIISPPFTFHIYSVTVTCKQTSCSNEFNLPLMLFLENVLLFCFILMGCPLPLLNILLFKI